MLITLFPYSLVYLFGLMDDISLILEPLSFSEVTCEKGDPLWNGGLPATGHPAQGLC